MQRLPFNPEALLAFFMADKSAAGLAGDLEERFQRIWRCRGPVRATAWFWWALMLSLPSIVIGALMKKQNKLPLSATPLAGVEAIGVLHQAVRIVNFPHEWNRFTLVGIEGGRALLNKWSNHQRFTVPLEAIVPSGSDPQAQEIEWVLTWDVRWERDESGYGSIWKV